MRLSVIVLTKNEEEMIEGCLKSAQSLGEILLIDDCSTDRTLEIARKYTDKIFVHKKKDFSDQRNFGLKKATGDWVFYLDADERVTPQLQEEISSIIHHPEPEQSSVQGSPKPSSALVYGHPSPIIHQPVAFLLKRRNFFLGKEMFPDKVHRLFRKTNLKGWRGPLHESPVFVGDEGELINSLIHFSHRDISLMLEGTLEWSKIEADLRFKAGHPLVCRWRLIRVMLSEFFRRFFKEKGFRFGVEGFIESVYQSFSLFITYVRLWEKQREKPLKETYKELEQKMLGD